MTKQCEFCSASMVNDASFCGRCGRAPSQIAQRATQIDHLSTMRMADVPVLDDAQQTVLSDSGKQTVQRTPSGALRPVTLIPLRSDDEEDAEEERRRQIALFGMGLPLIEEMANQPTPGQSPVVHGTPSMGQPPVVYGTPSMGQPPVVHGTPSMGQPPAIHGSLPVAQVPSLPGTPVWQGGPAMPGSAGTMGNPPTLPHPGPPRPLPPPPKRPIVIHPGGPAGAPPKSTLPKYRSSPQKASPGQISGFLPLGAVFLIAVLVVLGATVGLGLTVFAPGLSLSGNANVTPGGNLTLHGHNFLPGSSVILTLDNGTPLDTAQRPAPAQANAALQASTLYAFAASNTISVNGDGTFDVTIQILPTWTAGRHTVHATETVSRRSASLFFTIVSSNTPVTPTPTGTATASPSPTLSPTATGTTTPGAPALSCATPGNLSLGPISEFSAQTLTGNVTLCTTGTGTLTWRASWNQNQAAWLQMGQSSGTVQAPNEILATISASAARLAAGTYTATVTFLGVESNTTEVVNVTLTVKAGCVSALPQSLSFTGVAATSDPASGQTVSVTNCNLTSNWSATTSSNGNWLSLSSRKGTLKGGATQNLTVTASNLNAGLGAGTYRGSITFSIGSDTADVSVTLVVQPAPTISVSPANVNAAASPCSYDRNGNSDCTVTLTNNSSVSALTWSSSSSVNGVTVQATSMSIPAGSSEQVTIIIPGNNCGTSLSVTFTAPGNSASVTWTCTVLQ